MGLVCFSVVLCVFGFVGGGGCLVFFFFFGACVILMHKAKDFLTVMPKLLKIRWLCILFTVFFSKYSSAFKTPQVLLTYIKLCKTLGKNAVSKKITNLSRGSVKPSLLQPIGSFHNSLVFTKKLMSFMEHHTEILGRWWFYLLSCLFSW